MVTIKGTDPTADPIDATYCPRDAGHSRAVPIAPRSAPDQIQRRTKLTPRGGDIVLPGQIARRRRRTKLSALMAHLACFCALTTVIGSKADAGGAGAEYAADTGGGRAGAAAGAGGGSDGADGRTAAANGAGGADAIGGADGGGNGCAGASVTGAEGVSKDG